MQIKILTNHFNHKTAKPVIGSVSNFKIGSYSSTVNSKLQFDIYQDNLNSVQNIEKICVPWTNLENKKDLKKENISKISHKEKQILLFSGKE